VIERVAGFLRFWYDFIVGDDWMVAAGIVTALGLIFWLRDTTVPIWWVLPAAITILLPVSIWRVTRHTTPKPVPLLPQTEAAQRN
jgi:hypothetical protein